MFGFFKRKSEYEKDIAAARKLDAQLHDLNIRSIAKNRAAQVALAISEDYYDKPKLFSEVTGLNVAADLEDFDSYRRSVFLYYFLTIVTNGHPDKKFVSFMIEALDEEIKPAVSRGVILIRKHHEMLIKSGERIDTPYFAPASWLATQMEGLNQTEECGLFLLKECEELFEKASDLIDRLLSRKKP